jgi:SAM-dependent methyltransferase
VEVDAESRRTAWAAPESALVYDRGRPDYADAAVDFALAPVRNRPGLRALDLGAGTGKLTGKLTERGVDTVAVEPSVGMRKVLTHRCRKATVLAGSAEEIALPDDSVDVVVAGQAFHWFDRDRALPEVARVLRPGGVLGLLYNARDDAVAWVRALSEIIRETGDHATVTRNLPQMDLLPLFEAAGQVHEPHEQELDAAGLLDLVGSRSYVIRMAPRERAALLDRVLGLTRTHPELVGRQHFAVPYVTTCLRYRCAVPPILVESTPPGSGTR